MQRMSQTLPGADQKPTAAECAVRAMLYARAVRSLKRRLLPGRRRGHLRAQGLRGWKVRRATTGTQTLLSSGTRLKHHGRQAPGSLQGKLPQPDRSDAAKDCPPELAGPSPRDPSPEASGPSPKPGGLDVSEAPQTSSPCLSIDGECSPLSVLWAPAPALIHPQGSLQRQAASVGWAGRGWAAEGGKGTRAGWRMPRRAPLASPGGWPWSPAAPSSLLNMDPACMPPAESVLPHIVPLLASRVCHVPVLGALSSLIRFSVFLPLALLIGLPWFLFYFLFPAKLSRFLP